jgi:Fic family protein
LPRPKRIDFLEPLALDHAILNLAAGLDEFKGGWHSIASQMPDTQLATLGGQATVESVGSSTRMDGARMSDPEVDRFLFGPDPRPPVSRDERAVAGYAEALEMVYDAVAGEELDTEFVRRLHGVITWYSDTAGAERWEYRTKKVRVRAHDAAGRTAGALFEASEPGRIRPLMDELVRWSVRALGSGQYHPLLVTAVFTAQLRLIHPFTEGSGRLARLLATWMLVRSGYTHLPYSSLERILEQRRAQHHRALSGAAGLLKGDVTGLSAWVVFFLESLATQRDELLRRLDHQHRQTRLPELSVKLVDLARDGGRLTMARAIEHTGANRNTIKVHLRQLVAQGRLVRHGGGRGTWYTPS